MSLARALRNFSLNLIWLSVSYLIDAEDFFEPFFAPQRGSAEDITWAQLESVCLTSNILTSNSQSRINRLLLAAARAAQRMPKLRTLEIWNGAAQKGAIFCYMSQEDSSRIVWHTTSSFSLDPETIQAWRDVASTYARNEPKISCGQMSPSLFINTGSVIRYVSICTRPYYDEHYFDLTSRYLKTKRRVIHPTSFFWGPEGRTTFN